MKTLRLGTRGSQLALWQARTVAAMLQQASGSSCEIVVIKTSGDRLAEAPLSEAGGKRLFVKEIEDALLRGDIDLAVHSCKDMPVVLPAGLQIGAVLPREDPHDVVVLPAPTREEASEGAPPSTRSLRSSAPDGRDALLQMDAVRMHLAAARIGTSSVRRIAELRRFLPDARFEPIRGNLDTRLRKLDRGDHDALVLAAAGVRRLGFTDRISATLPFEICIPAPGQGAIAVEVREDDAVTRARARSIDHAQTATEVMAERAVVSALGGGCQTPIGAIGELRDGRLLLRGVVASPDGRREIRARAEGDAPHAAELGAALAAGLIRDGALDILRQVREAQGGEN